MRAIEFRPVKMQVEFAVVGWEPHNLLALNELFPNAPMGDQALNRANSKSVLLADLHQFGQTRHRTIMMQNFTKHPRGSETGHGGEVNCRFGVTCTPENTAILSPQWKDVARLNQVVRLRVWIRDRPNGFCPVMSADASRHPGCGID